MMWVLGRRFSNYRGLPSADVYDQIRCYTVLISCLQLQVYTMTTILINGIGQYQRLYIQQNLIRYQMFLSIIFTDAGYSDVMLNGYFTTWLFMILKFNRSSFIEYLYKEISGSDTIF